MIAVVLAGVLAQAPQTGFAVTVAPRVESLRYHPGRTLLFRSRVGVLRGDVATNWTIGAMDLVLAASAERSFSYSKPAGMRLQGVSLVLRAGTR